MAFRMDRLDPTQPTRCPNCRWEGTIGEAYSEPDDLVHCPLCFAPVRAFDVGAAIIVPTFMTTAGS